MVSRLVISEILPGLYLSGLDAVNSPEVLEEKSITHILNMTPAKAREADMTKFKFKQIPYYMLFWFCLLTF
jgi:hypothetical protein